MAADLPGLIYPPDEQVPMFVGDDPERRRRWALCVHATSEALGEARESAAVRLGAEALFNSDIETDDPPPEIAEAMKSELATQAERDALWKRFPKHAPSGPGAMGSFTLRRDKDGLFIHTHRARSKSYPSVGAIPESAADFIESTG